MDSERAAEHYRSFLLALATWSILVLAGYNIRDRR